jgi:UDP-N-acetylmuramyl tripeptide synthase
VLGRWTRFAVAAGRSGARLSRWLGRGEGAIIGGRLTAVLARNALTSLSRGREVLLVTGTNGKTTTSHLLAAALRTTGPVAHNHTGANMQDGVLAALCADQSARRAVLEVDELYLSRIAEQVCPRVIVLLNLSRDQLDRGAEVRAVSDAIASAVRAHPDATVVANADDPLVVAAVRGAAKVVWVGVGGRWLADSTSCPLCGRGGAATDTDRPGERRSCGCALVRPTPQWSVTDRLLRAGDRTIELHTGLPGQFNLGNAAMAAAAATELGVDPDRAVEAMRSVNAVAGRYASITYGPYHLRLILAKNPAGWSETLRLLDPSRPALLVVNAREADGRDTSWLWDVRFEGLPSPQVVVAGERAEDLALRLTYAEVRHSIAPDPLAGLQLFPPGVVEVVANYTAFRRLQRRLVRGPRWGRTKRV